MTAGGQQDVMLPATLYLLSIGAHDHAKAEGHFCRLRRSFCVASFRHLHLHILPEVLEQFCQYDNRGYFPASEAGHPERPH